MALVTIRSNTIHLPIAPSHPFATGQAALGLLGAGEAEAIGCAGCHRYIAALAAWFVLQAILANPQPLILRPLGMPDQLGAAGYWSPAELAKRRWHVSIDL